MLWEVTEQLLSHSMRMVLHMCSGGTGHAFQLRSVPPTAAQWDWFPFRPHSSHREFWLQLAIWDGAVAKLLMGTLGEGLHATPVAIRFQGPLSLEHEGAQHLGSFFQQRICSHLLATPGCRQRAASQTPRCGTRGKRSGCPGTWPHGRWQSPPQSQQAPPAQTRSVPCSLACAPDHAGRRCDCVSMGIKDTLEDSKRLSQQPRVIRTPGG